MIGARLSKDFATWKESKEFAQFAGRYIWWKPIHQAMKNPEQVIAQVMNMGDWDDVCRLVDCVREDALRWVMKHAEIGIFNARSWHYWHYRLGLAKLDSVPALPTRKLSNDGISLLAK